MSKSTVNGKNPPDDDDGAVGWWFREEDMLGGEVEYEREGSDEEGSYEEVKEEDGKNAFASVIGIVGNSPATSVLQEHR